MTHLRSVHAKQTVRGAGEYGPTREQVTVETDRARLIRECLRELKGVELIYAIRCKDGTIKIGWTRNINARRKQFDATYEALLSIQPGTYEQEQELHDRMSGSVARGREYYRPTGEVLDYVNGARKALGIDPITS